MRRFVEMPFSEKPEKNDTYLLARKKDDSDRKHRGDYYALEYTTEGGWNTWKDFGGEVHSDYEIPAEDLPYKYWLKPVSIGPEQWTDTLDTMIEEVSAKMSEYADRDLDKEESDEQDALSELYGLLTEAMDFAERFKE